MALFLSRGINQDGCGLTIVNGNTNTFQEIEVHKFPNGGRGIFFLQLPSIKKDDDEKGDFHSHDNTF